MTAPLIEGLLGATAVVLAVHLLWTPDLFESLVGFIVFGLLLTLVWAALGAADVALAEAAIGAGLTGALLLAAWRPAEEHESSDRGAGGGAVPPASWLLALAGAALGLVLQASLDPGSSAPLAEPVRRALRESGVASPVTAVLLNFRGYDTLLEVGVLVAAWLAATRPSGLPDVEPDEPASDVLALLARVWIPIVGLVSGYLVWAGSRWPGGAFQSAALLAGAAVLLHLVGLRFGGGWRQRVVVSRLPILGLVVFCAGAIVGLALRGRLLAYPHGHAGTWIVAIEIAMTISLAVLLVVLYHAVRHGRRSA